MMDPSLSETEVRKLLEAELQGKFEFEISEERVRILRFLGEGPDAVIPEGVTHIGDSAFEFCGFLEKISFPGTLTHIGASAFLFCERLRNLTLPENLVFIDESAFYGCEKLESVTFPDGLAYLGHAAFHSCGKLRSVTLPAGLMELGHNPFSWCSALEEIHVSEENPHFQSIDGLLFSRDGRKFIRFPEGKSGVCRLPASVEEIDMTAFGACRLLEEIQVDARNAHFRSVDGILYSHDMRSLLCCPVQKSGECVIPDGVTRIEMEAFALNEKLTSVICPDSVRQIEALAFSQSEELRTVQLPAQLRRLEERTFWHCGSLEELTLPDTLTFIGEIAFFGCRELGELRIPESVTEIADGAFDECAKLILLVVPNSAGHRYAEKNGLPFRQLAPADLSGIHSGGGHHV